MTSSETKTEAKPEINVADLLLQVLRESGVTASAPATVAEIIVHLRKENCVDLFDLDNKKKGRQNVRRALIAAVEASTVAEFDTEPKSYGLITGHEGKRRTATVSGTGTWRDGRSEATVKFWETWLDDVMPRLVADEGNVITDTPENRELVASTWAKGGKGYNERKLFRDMREKFPAPPAPEAAADEPGEQAPAGEDDEPSDEG